MAASPAILADYRSARIRYSSAFGVVGTFNVPLVSILLSKLLEPDGSEHLEFSRDVIGRDCFLTLS